MLGGLLKKGQKEALPAIIQCYERKLYRIVFAYIHSDTDAEDIVQETFIQVMNKIEQWQGKNFDAWLFRIGKNLALDFLKKKNSFRYFLPLEKDVDDPALPCEVLLEKEEKYTRIDEILAELPQRQRQILYLKHFRGYTIQEIARRQGCSEGTVKATLFQTFQKLKNRFQSLGLME